MRKILIVDDEEKIRELIRMNLELAGYKCDEAEDGEIALEKLNKFSPDLALLDIMLPKKNGYEIAQSFIKQNVPIIFLTAKDSVTDKVKGLKLGADDYIVKPFILPNLLARIEAVLRRCQWQKEAAPKQEAVLNKNVNIDALTPKEKEVLALVAKGASNQEIADQLYVRDVTVKTHLNSIFKKLKVTNRTQAVLLAMQMNLIS